MEYQILYNPRAGGGTCTAQSRKLVEMLLPDECVFYDMTAVSYRALFSSPNARVPIVLCGGDGTLNRFINDTAELFKLENMVTAIK